MAKKNDKLSIVILLCAILLFILGVRKSIQQQTQEQDLMNSFKIVDGSFVDCGVGKTADFGRYTFILNDKVYNNNLQVDKFCNRPNNSSCEILKRYKFPVAYSTKNPELNTMLLSKRDFGKYKIKRVDSLLQVYDQYFDCR